MLKKKRVRLHRLIAFLLVCVMLATALPADITPVFVYASTEAQAPETEISSESLFDRVVYADYLASHAGASRPETRIEVDVFNPQASVNTSLIDDLDGSPGLLTQEDGFAEWTVEVAQAGFYNLHVEYFPIQSRGVDIERRVYINGEIPFVGADALTFSRVWKDAGPIRQDNRGNDIRPSQTEAPRWESTYFEDAMGYIVEPYQFYFNQGENTLRLVGVNEPLVIRRLTVANDSQRPNYQAFIQSAENAAFQNGPLDFIYIKQGQDAEYRSSPTLYATYDRSSPATEPYSVDLIRLNMIGGYQWRVPGQWIEWEVEVPADGLYHLTFKSRQNYNRGNVSVRTLTIDGETPFQEVSEIDFKYTGDWTMATLSDENGEPYLFPLTQGKHMIRLDITLGEMGAFLSETEQIVNRLTAAYRKLLVLVGTTPDANRDYQVDKVYPDVMDYFRQEIVVLYDLVDRVTAYSGQRGAQIASAQTLAKKLERFLERPEIIPRSLDGLKTDIGALAAFILRMSESPLDIECVIVSSPGTPMPRNNTGFFARIAHEVRSFFASFYIDYNSIGNVYDENTEPLEVWMLSGRDQSQALKAIVDDAFTPEYGISVNIRLIASNVLLPSVVAGTGPDVALQVPSSEPVNYALRGSAVDLSLMPGFDEVKSDFFDSSFVPFQFNGGIYGLPESQGFPVLFYRTDILHELGLTVPDTWDDVIKMLPVLQKNNMDFGLATDDLMGMYGAFLNLLYQRGGTVYSSDGSITLLDNNLSVDAFETLTTMYTHYKLPKIYVLADRFRTGEMPMGVSDYTMFNQLAVSAPEIRGLWDFTLLPGHVDENGNINRSSTGGGVCAMMLPAAKDRDAAWTFLRWWVSADTQVRFGRELESLIGAAARYATANVKAFEQLAWSGAQREVIMEQWTWVTGTPEVPGGYYTSRHMLNALRKVMNNNEEPRETLLDYTRIINDELQKKRKEFGLE